MSSVGPEVYAGVLRERRAREAEELAARAEAALRAVSAIRDILVRDFAARDVRLFGSLARGDFHLRSDIDLAVWGLDPALYFRALSRIMRDFREFEVDLVEAERCGAGVAEAIAREGRAI